MTSSIYPISDSDWIVIKKVLPPEIETGKGTQGGRPHSDLRKILSGILYWIRTGCQWEFIPQEYGCKTSLAKYLKKWVKADVFNRLMTVSVEIYDQQIGIDWKFQSIDGSIKRAPGCKQNAGKNPTDRARPGSKHMILTDKNGIPLAAVVIPANVSDMNQLEATLVNISTQRPDPTEVRQHLCTDKGFDSATNRDIAASWGYEAHIREKGEGWIPIRKFTPKRWVVERTHAWINQFRGVHTRRIRNAIVYESMTLLACTSIILSKLG
jgi:putative transposase